jgi:ribosome-associated translation inhibitor RaiA
MPLPLVKKSRQSGRMKISFSQIRDEYRKAVEDESEPHIAKLKRLLKRYAPDLVQLHGSLEKVPRRIEYSFSLKLTLPTGALYATGDGADARSSTKAAFAEIEHQVKKHQEKLRKDYLWKRKRARGTSEALD